MGKMSQLKLEKMKKRVASYLDKERYEHTLGVMYTAGAMAMRYHVDLEKALIAFSRQRRV